MIDAGRGALRGARAPDVGAVTAEPSGPGSQIVFSASNLNGAARSRPPAIPNSLGTEIIKRLALSAGEQLIFRKLAAAELAGCLAASSTQWAAGWRACRCVSSSASSVAPPPPLARVD
jgi:hypothetical protein